VLRELQYADGLIAIDKRQEVAAGNTVLLQAHELTSPQCLSSRGTLDSDRHAFADRATGFTVVHKILQKLSSGTIGKGETDATEPGDLFETRGQCFEEIPEIHIGGERLLNIEQQSKATALCLEISLRFCERVVRPLLLDSNQSHLSRSFHQTQLVTVGFS